MNCKTMFRGSLYLKDLQRMSNEIRRVLVGFMFDHREELRIPTELFRPFFGPERYCSPNLVYRIVQFAKIDSAVVVKQYNKPYSWFVRLSKSIAYNY